MVTARSTRSLARFTPLAARAHGVELLDAGLLDPAELRTNLEDLARINRLPGGTAASVRAVRRLTNERGARVIDLGLGAADVALAFARRGWTVIGVDTNPDVLAVARNRTRADPDVSVVEADALALPFADDEFDVAHCSLLLHHFDRPAAVEALREMRRVARHGVVVNDLRRGVLPLIVTGALVMTLGRCRATRHDGILSARRAYTLRELDTMLAEAGLAARWRSPGWLPRVVTAATARD